MSPRGPGRTEFGAAVTSDVTADAERERLVIDRIRMGDADAFASLFREHYAALCQFALLHLGGESAPREAAEDIVQEFLGRLWAGRAEWYVSTSLRAYLYTSILNRVRNYRRGMRRSRVDLADVEVEPPAPDGSDAHMSAGELATTIRVVIAMLPERTREIFLLNRHAGLSYRDIAVRLGISVKTVEFHMGRALVTFRDQLAPWR